MNKKIAIILPSKLPVPATQGGAIEANVQFLIDENEKYGKLDITVFSSFERKAYDLSKSYKNTKFIWIRRGIFYDIINFPFRVIKKFSSSFGHFDCESIKFHLRRGNYDMVDVEGNTTYLQCVSQVVDKKRIVFYVHANYFNVKNQFNINFGKLPGNFVTVSEFIKNKIEINTETPRERIRVIKNPIDYDAFAVAKELIIPANILSLKKSNEFILLFAGRIVEDKGIRELIKALLILENSINFKLIVVGSFGSNFGQDENNDAFKKEVYYLASQLNDRIHFTGFVNNSLLPQYFNIVDIVIMPSLCEEAAGKVAMEAMASGIPVITTNAAGIPEYINIKAGILLDRDELFIENIARSIKFLANRPIERSQMGIAGKEIAKSFHPYRFYMDYINMILKTTGN